jgi:hypothetical protein
MRLLICTRLGAIHPSVSDSTSHKAALEGWVSSALPIAMLPVGVYTNQGIYPEEYDNDFLSSVKHGAQIF